jgi:hypothetical protein
MANIKETTTTEERIDPKTGEFISKVHTVTIGTPNRSMDLNFVKIYPAFFSSFLQELKIDDGKARLVLYLVYRAIDMKSDSDNVVVADNKELMGALNISKPTLIRYIAELCKLKVIERLKPRMPVYRINPNMIYKGVLTKYYSTYIKDKTNNIP